MCQEGLGRLSEDSDEGVYSHHHSLPWETRPAPAYQGEAAVATSAAEEDEQPLELVKRKQDPEGRSRDDPSSLIGSLGEPIGASIG